MSSEVCKGINADGDECNNRHTCTLYNDYINEYLTPHHVKGDKKIVDSKILNGVRKNNYEGCPKYNDSIEG